MAKEQNSSNLGKMAGIAALSAAAGAVAAAMLTPKSGRELRGNIKNKAHDLSNKAKDEVDKVDKKVAS